MKMLTSKSKTVFVMTSTDPPGCPRILLSNKNSAVLKDDYQGKMRAGKNLLKKLCSF